jgi:uncharacterized protein YacL
MSRTGPEVQRYSSPATSPASDSISERRQERTALQAHRGLEFWILRASVLTGTAALCYMVSPFGLHGPAAAGIGFLLASVVLLAELRLRQVGIGGLLGGALGIAGGLFSALIVTLIVSRTTQSGPTKSFLDFAALCAFAYLGVAVGSEKGRELYASSRPGAPLSVSPFSEPVKLLDTSVLIDGRIADVCEAHFLDGVLAVPQFVLHELQLVADSSDTLKRQRGRRGLEVLQRLRKMPHVELRILDQDLPSMGDVDHKLVELARQQGAKIVTNDFNLNKVATVQGLSVLNVNQLANALKPVVLPGEPMRVLILREGKEPNQGVAYLDDGTMVVVDGGRRLINKMVDIQVTSVHQTAAGKMIFGRLEERQDQPALQSRQAVARVGRVDTPLRLETGSRLPDPPQVDRGPRSAFSEPSSE